MKKYLCLVAVVVCACVDWTRLSGIVKATNLKTQTVTLLNRDGDLLTIPVDYEVQIVEKNEGKRDLAHLKLDEKVTLLRVPEDRPPDDTTGMASPEPGPRAP